LDKELGKLIMNWNLPFIGILSLAATLHAFYLTHGTDVSSLTSLAALKHVGLEWIVNFLFLNGLNNLSTRFFGDVVRIGQCRNMSVDSHMVIETNRAIPDSLGNVQVIISDKTGTLTKNELKCEKLIFNCDPFASTPQEFSLTNPAGIKQAIQRRDDQSKAVERFLTFMAVANGVMPKARPNAENLTKETVYFSSNPDDLEFVNIAKALDTELMERFTSTEGQQFVRVRTRLDDAPEEDEVRWHTVKMQLLQEHEFVSSRKYMSAVLKCPGSGGELNLRSSLSSSPCQVLLVLKGADESPY
jgi:magnesium-transporting ATPase (P-type)